MALVVEVEPGWSGLRGHHEFTCSDIAVKAVVGERMVLHITLDEQGLLRWTVHDTVTNAQLSGGQLALPHQLVDLPPRRSP